MKTSLSIRHFLDRASLVYGDRPAIIDEPQQPASPLGTLSYRELHTTSLRMAFNLEKLGIGVGDRVGIISHNASRLLLALYAVPGSGRVLVPINYRLNPAEVRYIVEHSGVRLLLVDPELADAMEGVTCERKVILGDESDAILHQGADVLPPVEIPEDSTATINYTSGTTARPKGVALTHRNLWINAVTFGLHLGISDRDVYLHTLPTFHCNGWGMPFVLASMGVRQVVIRKIDGAEILRRVEAHGVTLMNCAPAVVNAVLEAARDWEGPIPGHGRVRVVVAGAAPPTTTIERVETELGWEFIQIYGLTETSPLLTFNRGREEWDNLSTHERARRLGRAGAPSVGTEIRIDGHGEILARSNTILAGYWAQPEATKAAIVEGWFHTGDGGSLDEEGYLTISDRKKDVIITGGENVTSIEVEDALFSHDAVAEVAVIGVPHDKWGETVKALVVCQPGVEVTGQELIDHCRDRLAHYKCPTSVEFRTELARTATGKLQKFLLRAPYWEGFERQIN